MLQPGRAYSSGTGYRYGFNGKEKSDEIANDSYDFGARIYDGRIGRWLSMDPLQIKYPGHSPYNYVSNTPINAIDPDGKLIIFINGLWGPPNQVGQGGTPDYWGTWKNRSWVSVAQDAIGDHKDPMFIDGSLGGTPAIPGNLGSQTRLQVGGDVGFRYAKAIFDRLDKDETIKIITNSMGAAFERGFTQGFLKYQELENEKRKANNAQLERQLTPLYARKKFLEAFKAAVPIKNMTKETQQKLANDLNEVNSQITALESRKQDILDVKIEMVVDLSSHQIDYADPNAQSSYYMTAEENVTSTEKLGGFGVKEKHIKGAKYLGKMSAHHSSGADPNLLPSAKKRN